MIPTISFQDLAGVLAFGFVLGVAATLLGVIWVRNRKAAGK